MNVDHGNASCRINATDASALLPIAAISGFQQKCGMENPQQQIASWMVAMQKKHAISVTEWAKRAKVGRDSIYRAMNPDYEHVTSTSVLSKMASALGETPPTVEHAPGLASVGSLAGVLTELFASLAPTARVSEELILIGAEALQDTLAALAADPDAAADPAKSRAVARALVRRLAH